VTAAPADGLIVGTDGRARCWWCRDKPDYAAYHDAEWGRPVGDDIRLFEKLCLEGFQSGLSWLTILRKRANFRSAFAGFDYRALAEWGEADVERLLGDAGIVRHRGKIEAALSNARRAIDLVAEAGSLARFFWSFEPPAADRPARLDYATALTLAKTDASTALSKALKKRGWRFVGPTTMYALMQAMGIVNDHLDGCFVRADAEAERSAFKRP